MSAIVTLSAVEYLSIQHLSSVFYDDAFIAMFPEQHPLKHTCWNKKSNTNLSAALFKNDMAEQYCNGTALMYTLITCSDYAQSDERLRGLTIGTIIAIRTPRPTAPAPYINHVRLASLFKRAFSAFKTSSSVCSNWCCFMSA